MSKFKTRIISKVFGHAHECGWTNSLAIFVRLRQINSGGSFYWNNKTERFKSIAKEVGCSPSTLRKHLKVLEDNNLVNFTKNSMHLASLRKQKEDYGSTNGKMVFVPAHIRAFKDIKDFFKVLIPLSKLEAQKKVINKKEDCVNTWQKVSQRKRVSREQWLEAKRVSKKYGQSLNKKIFLSYSTFKELIGKTSDTTVIRYKKILERLGFVKWFNDLVTVDSNVNRLDFINILRYSNKYPKGSFWYSGNVYLKSPSEFLLTSCPF